MDEIARVASLQVMKDGCFVQLAHRRHVLAPIISRCIDWQKLLGSPLTSHLNPTSILQHDHNSTGIAVIAVPAWLGKLAEDIALLGVSHPDARRIAPR